MGGLRGLGGSTSDAVNALGALYAAGAHIFEAPATGRYMFTLWGGGAVGGGTGGGSGAFAQKTRRLRRGETVSIVVGASAGASTATFIDGSVVTAGAGTGTGGGLATGGDLNLNGSSGGTSGNAGDGGGGTAGGAGGANQGADGGGAGAPGQGLYKGGRGGSQASAPASAPGGGGAGGTGVLTAPGSGLCIVERV